MKWVGRFLIGWPFLIILATVLYGFLHMDLAAQIGLGFLLGMVASIIAGIAVLERYE